MGNDVTLETMQEGFDGFLNQGPGGEDFGLEGEKIGSVPEPKMGRENQKQFTRRRIRVNRVGSHKGLQHRDSVEILRRHQRGLECV